MRRASRWEIGAGGDLVVGATTQHAEGSEVGEGLRCQISLDTWCGSGQIRHRRRREIRDLVMVKLETDGKLLRVP